MSLFDDPNATLENVLGQQATDQANTIQNQYAKKRRQSVAQEAASGRLRSGVSNYTAGDINASEAGDLGNVYGGLANALGQIPTTDYTTEQDYNRQLELARLIGNLNKPSGLEEALGGLKTAGDLAATYAAFA